MKILPLAHNFEVRVYLCEGEDQVLNFDTYAEAIKWFGEISSIESDTEIFDSVALWQMGEEPQCLARKTW